jgi:hypothetical protein
MSTWNSPLNIAQALPNSSKDAPHVGAALVPVAEIRQPGHRNREARLIPSARPNANTDGLLISQDDLGDRNKIKRRKIDVDHAFEVGTHLLLTIVSGPNGTIVYKNC